MTTHDTMTRTLAREARMMGDPATLARLAATTARAPECESCGEMVASVDDNSYCASCAASVLAHALAHGVVWRCDCGHVEHDGEDCSSCGAYFIGTLDPTAPGE